MLIKDKNKVWPGGVVILFFLVEIICLFLFSPDSVSSWLASLVSAVPILIWAMVVEPKKSSYIEFFLSNIGKEFWIIHEDALLDYSSSDYVVLNSSTSDTDLLNLNLSLSSVFCGLIAKERWLEEEDQVYKRKIIKKGSDIKEIVETKEGETISFINEAKGIDGTYLISRLSVKFEDEEIGSFLLARKVYCKDISDFPKQDQNARIDVMYVTENSNWLYTDIFFNNLQRKPWVVPANHFELCAWGDPICGVPDGLTSWNKKDAKTIRDILSRMYNRMDKNDPLGRKLLEIDKDGAVWCYSIIFHNSSPILKCPEGEKLADNIQGYRKLEEHYKNIYWHRFVIVLWITLGHLVAYISIYAAIKG